MRLADNYHNSWDTVTFYHLEKQNYSETMRLNVTHRFHFRDMQSTAK